MQWPSKRVGTICAAIAQFEEECLSCVASLVMVPVQTGQLRVEPHS